MSGWSAVFTPISFLAILALIGYIAEKTRFVSEISSGLSRVIVNIALPITVIISLSDQDVGYIPFPDIVTVAGIAFGSILVSLVVHRYTAGLLKIEQDRRLIHSYLGSFGNVIFLGYPFISQLFGEIGLFYAIIFSIVNELLVWSAGAFFLNKQAQGSGKWSLKYLLNPNTLSFCIGIIMLSFGLKFPEVVHAPLSRISAATVPLSMLFIGSMLAKTQLKYAIKNLSIWSICFVKMLVAPLAIIGIAYLFGFTAGSVNGMLLSVAVLQVAMPSQTNLSVLADRYKADASYAAQTIFLSTLLSILTLPIVYFIAMQLLGS